MSGVSVEAEKIGTRNFVGLEMVLSVVLGNESKTNVISFQWRRRRIETFINKRWVLYPSLMELF